MLAIFFFTLAWAITLAFPTADQNTTPNPALTLRSDAKPKLGINCRWGSTMCGACDYMFYLGELIDTIPSDASYAEHEYIACNQCLPVGCKGTCVFTQRMGGRSITGAKVKELYEKIRYKCCCCGSVPLEGDDVNNGKGELTVSFVHDGCCSRVCPRGFFAGGVGGDGMAADSEGGPGPRALGSAGDV